ncbi:MAG TPA: ABC transporter permease [Gemmatimonadaceae bacterium]|nr:ABC transporter permease [Gemmatimonadaceae bacterium]
MTPPPPRSWKRLFRFPWRTTERDVDTELSFHFDERIAELEAAGMPATAARAQAEREFGDPRAVRETLVAIDRRTARSHARRSRAEAVAQTFRMAARRLVRQPAFFALTAASLAIALGATTAASGFADAWSHPVSPFADPNHAVSVTMWGGPDHAHGGLDWPDRWKFIENTEAFGRVAFVMPTWDVVRAGDETFRAQILDVTPNLIAVAGLTPQLGRWFTPASADADAVLVSDYVWHRYFGNRASTDGASIAVGARTYDVIGVMPRGTSHPIAGDVVRLEASPGTAISGWPIVRLKPSATIASAQAEVDAVAKIVNARSTDPSRPYGFGIHPLDQISAPRLTGLHYIFLLVSRFVLVIACANVAALLLARTAARRRDLALRLALGAGRMAIVGDVLAELVIISLVGCVAGLVLANGATGVVRSLIPADLAWNSFVDLRWSWRVFASSGATLLFVVAAAGYLPALQVSRIPPADPLKESSGGATGRRPQRMKSVVMLQLAMALALLIVTSVLSSSILQMSFEDVGYNPRMVTVATGNYVYRWNTSALNGQTPTQYLVPLAERQQGVTVASYYFRGVPDGLQVISDDIGSDQHPVLAGQYTIAGPRFMEAVGIPVIDGRDFAAGDSVGDGAVILDDSAAKTLFPSGRAVGRRVKLGRPASNEPWRPVIGVVRSVATRFPSAKPNYPSIYVATSGVNAAPGAILARSFAIVARAGNADDAAMLPLRIRRAFMSVMPTNVQLTVGSLTADRDASMAAQRQFAELFGSLSAGALLFAAAGLFAVLSYMVRQRMREFGIRVAIGAAQRDVGRLVLKDALELALGGTAIGGAGGIAATLVIWAPEFGTDIATWVSVVGAEVVLICVVMLASLGPARRAMRADPVDVLRSA